MKNYEKLSLEEIHMIEENYNYNFPDKFIRFLNTKYYIDEKGYNWKDFSKDNIRKIQSVMAYPLEYVKDNVVEIEWNKNWGVEPILYEDKRKKIDLLLKSAPKLFPVFSHRYIPIINHHNPPVLSIHGLDVIYYGKTYKKYIKKENGKNLFFSVPSNLERSPYVPFWTDLM